MNTTITATRTFTATALDNEFGRRRNNRKRKASGEPTVRAKSFVLPKLSKDDAVVIKGGGIVTVEFDSGRVEFVGLKANSN